MNSSKKVSIILVNWNGRDIINASLSSLQKISYPNLEIIVVDNNSKDNSVSLIKKNYPNVKIIKNKKNLGFAGGNNSALQYITGDYILLFNTDAIATRHFLQPLIQVLDEDEKAGIVQPLVLYQGNDQYEDKTINSAGSLFLNTGFLYYPGYGQDSQNIKFAKKRKIFSAYGACMLIKKGVIDQVGLFDEDFFMYFEETDFCIRALLANWDIYYQPKSVIYHRGGLSSKNYGISRIYFHSFKNRIVSYLKNFNYSTLFFIMPIHLVMCEVTAFLYLLTGKPQYFVAIQKAIFWNITQIGKTYKKRKDIQSTVRKIDDNKFLKNLQAHPRLAYYLYLFKGLQYYKE